MTAVEISANLKLQNFKTLPHFLENLTMPFRCVAGGCSKTRKDGVSLHRWPDDPHFARLWTNVVKNTRSDFGNPTTSSRLCSDHFDEDCFEPQTVIVKFMGLQMKQTAVNSLKSRFKKRFSFALPRRGSDNTNTSSLD